MNNQRRACAVRITTLILLATSALPAAGDLLLLKDGKKLEGEIENKGSVYDVKTKYGVLSIPKSEVEKTLQAADAMTKEAVALKELAEERAKEGKPAEAVESLQNALNIYNETREIYSWDSYVYLDEAAMAILQQIAFLKTRQAPREPPAAASVKPEEKAEPKPTVGIPPTPTPKIVESPAPPAKASPLSKASAPKWAMDMPATLVAKAEAGNAESQYALALQYRKKVRLVEAAWWFGKASAQGHLKAQIKLGLMCRGGVGVKRNYGEAMKWFQKAEAQNSAVAQFNVARLYEEGWGVPKDNAAADERFRKAASRIRPLAVQGDVEAQFALGRMLEHGKGFVKNEAEAFDWYQRAAAQGHSMAFTNLGYMLFTGYKRSSGGVKKDYVEALKYFRIAADHGDAMAAFNIGSTYEHGNGVKIDLEEAQQWYLMAAQQGHEWAIWKLQNLTKWKKQ